MPYFDTHCHLNHESFSGDLEQVISNALKVGVNYILVPGWDVESSKKAVELSNKYSNIFAAVGIHPTEWQKADDQAIEEISRLALDPHVVAIGEIGLDFHHDPDHKDEQSELLFKMLSISEFVHKPVIIHSRASIDSLVVLLSKRKMGTQPGILHAFEGNLSQALRFIDMGFLLGVGGPLTYKNSFEKQEVFANIPADSIVLETDAPYLPPVPFRGKRNEPAHLPLVGSKLSELRNQDTQNILDCVFQNSYKMFLEENNH